MSFNMDEWEPKTKLGEQVKADQAGIIEGDVIIGIDGEPIKTVEELNKIKSKFKAGETVKITLSRNGTDVDVNVKLQEANANITSEGTQPNINEN